MSDRNNPVPQNMHAWMRQMEKRMATMERRPSAIAASVGLGSASNLGKVVGFYGPKTAAAGGGFNPVVDGEPDLDWLVMDGSNFSQIDYPNLYSHLGDTTLLPDITDRSPVAAGVAALGDIGGAKTITLSADQLPAHAHGIRVSDNQATSTAAVARGGGTNQTIQSGPVQSANGPGNPINIQTPWFALWFLIGAV